MAKIMLVSNREAGAVGTADVPDLVPDTVALGDRVFKRTGRRGSLVADGPLLEMYDEVFHFVIQALDA
jgi:hypothetical protein